MSYHNPTLILMADILRDGGSYFVMYQADDKNQYLLKTQVHLDHDMKRLGYERPNIFCEATSFSRQLTWAEAQKLGDSLILLKQQDLVEGNLERLRECLDVFGLSGGVKHSS